MAWSTPATWVAGIPTVANFNARIRDQFNALGDPWTAYVPALTGWSLGNGTLTGVVREIGKEIQGTVTFTYGSTTTPSGNLRISLPVTKISGLSVIGNAQIFDTSASTRFHRVVFATTSTEMQFASEADARATSTVPMTWATGDTLIAEFRYQAA